MIVTIAVVVFILALALLGVFIVAAAISFPDAGGD